ncbi:hypothetical protein N8I77_009611 [Diaporthe amygdali]|uniref:Heterokaryon incompatibility domain-containing protein n=1 Tax=Phomopsis amygdali TaxID=1214568 RepID=A0AAD9S9W5_PHOAM|nr:hypothetical protein N8I77_009611 [Diaporthe amygdali]
MVVAENRQLDIFIGKRDRVTCRLITAPLRDCPPYTALTYVWGKATNPVSIQVDYHDSQATISLALALRCIPQHWKFKYPSRALGELRVWADAVCINQHDLVERAQKLQLMDLIYQRRDGHLINTELRLVQKEVEVFSPLRETEIRRQSATSSIFQEIVLVQEALLICKSSCTSPTDAIDRVFCWFDLLELCDLSPPSFISPGHWQSLISGSGLSRVTLTGHFDTWKRRRMEFPVVSLAATDPKDHVYSLLGVTGIDIRVDYSDRTSVARVFHDATTAWLKDYASQKEDKAAQVAVSGMKELWFLGLAGLRPDCNDNSCMNFSSWAPNFPHFHHDRSDYVFFTKVNADDGVFSDAQCLETSYIQDSSLFVTGLVIDSVRETYPQHASEFSELRPRRCLLRDLFELLCWSDLLNSILNARLHVSDPSSFEYLAFACAFVWAVLGGGFQYRTAIERLVLRLDTETGLLQSLRETFLDLEEGSEEDYEDKGVWDLARNPSSWLQDLVECEVTGEVPKENRLASCTQRMMTYIGTDGLDDCSLLRTSRGYFGLASKKAIMRGDFVCALKGYDSVASLRENGDHFLYVGDTKVQGMMEGQAAKLLKGGLAGVQQLELG